jgi:hypothetical protein
MNENLRDTVKQIISQYGVEILNDSKRVNALLNDLAPKEPKGEKKAFIACLMYGFYTELQNTTEDRQLCKIRLAQKLHDDEGLDVTLCADTITLLETVLQSVNEKESEKSPEENAGEVTEPPNPAENTIPETAPAALLNQTIKDAEIERLTTELDQSNQEKKALTEKLESTKVGLAVTIVLGVIAIAISIGVGVNQYNGLMDDYNSLIRIYNSINVTSIKVGNWNNNQWITMPGGSLSASQMRFLIPVITYDSLINENIYLYVRIINPDGSVNRNPSTSPVDYTYSHVYQVSRGKEKSLELQGWGSDSGGVYSRGLYTVEVWYADVCLRSEKVKIN